MYNAVNKFAGLALCCAMACLSMHCTDSDKKVADKLLAQAQTALDDSLYVEAMQLVDSLDRSCPSCLDERRKGMLIRSKAMTEHLQRQLFSTDSLIVVYDYELQQLSPMFAHVEYMGEMGYYYYKPAGMFNSATTCAQARVSDADYLYSIIVNNAGSKIGVDRITLNAANGSCSTPRITDQRVGDTDLYGSDMTTFAPTECDSIGHWAYQNAKDITSLTISGEKGSTTVNLSRAQAEQFGMAWRFALVSGKLATAKRLRDKIQRQIIVARDHTVNLE